MATMKRGRPPGPRTDETRVRILRAAEKEVAAAGYDGARTVAIARRARVTHAMLHYYFETKQKLYQGVHEAVLIRLSEELNVAVGAAARGQAGPPLRRLLTEA